MISKGIIPGTFYQYNDSIREYSVDLFSVCWFVCFDERPWMMVGYFSFSFSLGLVCKGQTTWATSFLQGANIKDISGPPEVHLSLLESSKAGPALLESSSSHFSWSHPDPEMD